MGDVVIRAAGLGKRYRAGGGGTGGLRHALEAGVRRLASVFLRGNSAPPAADFWALRDVSFEIRQGEVIGVLGRNGAGKSTLLKILSRITDPTEGEVRLRGRVGSLLEVGTGFHPELSGRENIYLNGAVLGMTRREVARRFDEIVSFSELPAFLDTPVKFYSSGMYTRLAFAVAAHLEADILLVDEVLAVGDAPFQQKCLGKMGEVTRGGRTVVFVSHNMQAVASLCATALHLDRGRVVDQGPAERIITSYLASVGSAAGVRWEGDDGDSELSLLSVAAIGEPDGTFRTDREFRVRVRFRVGRPLTGLVCAVEILDRLGARLVYTAHDDHEPPPAPEIAAGEYTWELTVPPNTFAAGTYRVEVDLGIHSVRRVTTGAAGLAVNLDNIAGLGRRFLAHTDVVRPAWAWRPVPSSDAAIGPSPC